MELDSSSIELSKYDKEREIILPSEVTEDLAYLCGILAGDGYIAPLTDIKHKYTIICCGNPKDEKEFYLQVVIPLLSRLFNIKIVPKVCSDGTIRIRIGSKGISTFLVNLIGLPTGKKYDSLKIPKLFLNNEKLKISFIRGVFDTDGCICFKKDGKPYPHYPVITLSSKSYKFIKEISDELKILGFRARTYSYKVKDYRFKLGYNLTNRIELHGVYNFILWNNFIKFSSPKHLDKIMIMSSNITTSKNIIAGVGFEPTTCAH